MDELARTWGGSDDPAAIFVEAYRTMTANMLTAVQRSAFADGAWVERLLTGFAEYYFEAVDGYERRTDTPCPPAWEVAMDARRRDDLHPMQHLFLGVNAHINRDLPFVLVDVLDDWAVMDQQARRLRHADHLGVNDVIGRTIDAVQDEVIASRSPGMGVLDRIFGPLDEWAFSRLIASWRDDVWDVAVALLDADPSNTAGLRRTVEERALHKANLMLAV